MLLHTWAVGTAIAALFARNGHVVTILDRNEERCKAINETHMNPSYVKGIKLPDTVSATTDPSVAFKDCVYCFHAIPIQASVDYLTKMKAHLKKDVPIVSMSKGPSHAHT